MTKQERKKQLAKDIKEFEKAVDQLVKKVEEANKMKAAVKRKITMLKKKVQT